MDGSQRQASFLFIRYQVWIDGRREAKKVKKKKDPLSELFEGALVVEDDKGNDEDDDDAIIAED
jgi:hypothetical protein